MKNKANIELLLDQSPKSFYWWGYIIADGSMDKNYNITLTCNIRDLEHITKYADYISKKVKLKVNKGYYTKKEKTTCLVTIANKTLLKPFKEQTLEWVGQKTYNPIKLDYFNNENLIYFLLGLIDGDGCLYLTKNWSGKNSYKNCRIVLHDNWLNFLEKLKDSLVIRYDIKPKVSKNSRSNAVMYFNEKECNKLLKYIKDIPFMKRKWKKLGIN